MAQHIEDLPAERPAGRFQLGQQPPVHLAFAGALREHVPQVAYLPLPDPVDAPEALLQAVRIPGQVVVHHQVRPLQVDSFAGGVGGQQDADFRVLDETLLRFAPDFARQAAVDDRDGFRPSDPGADAPFQVFQRRPVFGEQHQFLARRSRRRRDRSGAVRRAGFGGAAVRDPGEDLALEDAAELEPFGVVAAAAHFGGNPLQPAQRFDLGFQLGDRLRGGRLVEDFAFRFLPFVVGQVVEFVQVLRVEEARSPRR